MEIIASSSVLDANDGKIIVNHAGAEVLFHFSSFKKDSFDKNDVFSHLNLYWKGKPRPYQDEVFKIYVEISDLFFQTPDKKLLAAKLNEALKRLYALHPFEEMRNWLIYRSGITLPEISESYVPDSDRDYTPEKTYIRKEYIDLLTMAFMLRISVPVWSYFIRIVKDYAGTGLKENNAFKLLAGTELFEHPAISKMKDYINSNNKKQVVRSGAIGVLSPEDHPYWIMAQFCVRKLAVAELQFKEPKATLVSLLYNFTKTCNTEGHFKDRYKDKNSSRSDGDELEGNKASVYERHRNSSDLSVEEAAELETTLSSRTRIASLLNPNLPKDLLKRSIKTAAVLLDPSLITLTSLPCQKTIMGWVLSPVLTPKGIPYQTAETIIKYAPLIEALLWHKGFYYLALLVTSRTPLDNQVHHVVSTPVRSRLTDENQRKIREYFPHVRLIQNRKSDPREECFVINSIDQLSTEIGEYTWVTTADESMMVQLQKSPSRRLNLIPDIRNEIARLIIAINSRSLYV